MEKNPTPEKSVSFSNTDHTGSESDPINSNGQSESVEDSSSIPDLTLSQVLEEVDQFIQTLSSSNPPQEVPNSVESLSNMVESMIVKYELKTKFGQDQESDSSFIESVHGISKLINKLGAFPSNSTTNLNRASCVLHRAMLLLDDEFRTLLENSRHKISDQKTPHTPKQSSFNSHNDSVVTESESHGEEEFPAFSPESISTMNRIATAMISSGYETECCMVYGILRRNAFKSELKELGLDNISIEDVQRMHWESLEGEIATWTSVVKHCSTVLFSKERKLCDSVFSDFPSISERLFIDLASAVVTRFINFAEAVVLTKRSAEKLFKFLDMYEALRDLIPALDDSYQSQSQSAQEMISETCVAKSRLGEAAASIFSELENSIKSDNSRTPVPSGTVHPLTRYTMNYLKYACEYKDTLEQIFQKIHKFEKSSNELNEVNSREIQYDDRKPKSSPFSIQLMTVMDLLDANLDMKSKLYRDPALRYIFLMNNGRYIYQKIKGSTEIHEMMGDNWCRKRSSDLRQYHKNYQRETWSRLLQCISHEGLQVNGKISKPVLKERFKSFNQMFDEIHKTQSTWVVSDEQLQSELRVSISAVVIPCYRSFLGRFKQYIDSGRATERYVKYQPEDIETLIEELFDGNPTSMARRRT